MHIYIFNTLDNRIYFRICLLFLAVLLIAVVPIEVMAQNNDDAISRVLCNIVKQLNGPIGKGISTIAIIVLGIGLFLGKLSWGLAVATAIGIGMIFGAAQIVAWISNGVTASPIIFSEICP
ncbi:Type IV secretory pathway, VirB2 components (pilins) [Rickettsiales bacterium Ac37b]|nr:Type IV secretory pathway, VirB2 components (pilins) [Rickettsiales bacterium Ac37b]